MIKNLFLIAITILIYVTSCGPDVKDKEKKKRMSDSTVAAEKLNKESDSLDKILKANKVSDSITDIKKNKKNPAGATSATSTTAKQKQE
jgi:hypothetical protein